MKKIFNDSVQIPIVEMPPLIDWEHYNVREYILIYSALFLIGVCGNVSVITLIRLVHTSLPYDNTVIYILFLSIVDLVSIAPLPLIILDQMLGFWIFNTPVCKVYRCMEHAGRALSTFVLTEMAFDRYLLVCYPYKKRSRNTVIKTLICLTIFALFLLSPVIYVSSKISIILQETVVDEPPRIIRMRIFKCMANFTDNQQLIFVSYMFLLAFAAPMFLIILFYSLMIKRLVERSRVLSSSSVPVNRIAFYTITISIFYLICYLPYWISHLYARFRGSSDTEFDENGDGLYGWMNDNNNIDGGMFFNSPNVTKYYFIRIMYGIHALPFVNSSLNWFFYGLLNSQLIRKTNRTNQKGVTATTSERFLSLKRQIKMDNEESSMNSDNAKEEDKFFLKTQCSLDTFL
ncbi:G protein-coupled receptor, rhodopsin-like family and GPCR, rhodopsin-like, 7TM domain-containing protein [Strongyloides ratti]|uniref:G protein-coupled receptor, rhodopsin-like family and GPCR, rhodopsin-like, 7TM domain-containing protein n=1 Tax=Strongyloides ratti TaxID=34506 RepID=A0A090MVN6_STRRB|nr:G protein-coupled receptor, rhodopsin-like family and GPCR, rhodopsin-like, 7TM domain-containing protein [Strongyloides ratti]CEF63018.1 G protein-coupled receptor, rhodopsin-like family and GPCR, rhodopsin-like, 7TM domain-containing protein [Strongyloides ratti]